jgi:hypothetical protein
MLRSFAAGKAAPLRIVWTFGLLEPVRRPSCFFEGLGFSLHQP